MLEFIRVEAPPVYPQLCVCCTSTKGPMADTHRETPGSGRVYVCEMCVKRLARVFGLVEGPRMDELLSSAVLLDERDREVRDLLDRVGRLEPERESLMRTIASRDSSLRDAEATLASLRERLSSTALAVLSAIGIGVADPEVQEALSSERDSLVQALAERDAEIRKLSALLDEARKPPEAVAVP